MGSDGQRRRVDRELVRRGLVPSREEAQRVIDARRVQVDGAPVRKASSLVLPSQQLLVGGPPPRFVSRGGEKLQGALDRFAIDLTGLTVLDAGISTGGFTDCALQAGAVHVIGVDVGYGQLAERLRRDPRVSLHERTNVRLLGPGDLPGLPADVLVADLSFISLTTVLPVLLPLVRPEGSAVVLVKPQFEVGRARVGRGGIVRDPQDWRAALLSVAESAATIGWPMHDLMPSPITGAQGNVEFLALLRRDTTSEAPHAVPVLAGLVDTALAEIRARIDTATGADPSASGRTSGSQEGLETFAALEEAVDGATVGPEQGGTVS
jgi:23S rRNA (cytidine1920-2'-O)/16S rRNA (cytidine1409-2'-O)-methyltransferase